MNTSPEKGYVADKSNEYRYPAAGDELPPGGAKVLLLTRGHVCTTGTWGDPFFIGWAPLPRRNKEKEAKT